MPSLLYNDQDLKTKEKYLEQIEVKIFKCKCNTEVLFIVLSAQLIWDEGPTMVEIAIF